MQPPTTFPVLALMGLAALTCLGVAPSQQHQRLASRTWKTALLAAQIDEFRTNIERLIGLEQVQPEVRASMIADESARLAKAELARLELGRTGASPSCGHQATCLEARARQVCPRGHPVCVAAFEALASRLHTVGHQLASPVSPSPSLGIKALVEQLKSSRSA